MKIPVVLRVVILGACAGILSTGCRAGADSSAGLPKATPIYNKDTGKLEQLVSDANGDGKPDTRAHMDGATLKHVEIDRDADGRPDRWEYYGPAVPGSARPGLVLVRAEEANGSVTPTRKEFYENGVIARVEEDADADGKVDKWEFYAAGALVRMDLDLTGRGTADRRLTYDAGNVVRVEGDPDGDGTFTPMPEPNGRGRAGGEPQEPRQ